MEKNTDRLYTLIITTIIGILFLGGITYGIFQAAHTMLNSQANTTAMRNRTAISKQNVSSDLAAITNANIKFGGKDPITGQKVIKEFTKNGLDYSVNTDTNTVSITGMTDDALSTDSSGHISLTIPKTVTDSQNKSYTITSIADQTFMNRKIYHVTLPDSIVYIGAQAFYNSHLGDLTQDGKFDDITADRYNHGDERNLTIPAKIKFIGREAFADNYLYSITIPNADDLASLDVTATDHNALAYKSADQINTSPVDTKFDKAFVKLQYSSASAYDKRVKSSSAQKYTFISGSYQDYFIMAKRPNEFVNQYHWEGDKLYFYGSNGQPITGFRHYGNNELEYYGTDHVQYRNRYYQDGDKLYYFGDNGDAITGLRHYGDGKLEFYGADHVQYRNRYASQGDQSYYFGSNGDAVTGLRPYGNNQLEYYGADHVQYRNRYYQDGDKLYYFGSNGNAITGLRHYGDGKLEYYGTDHVQYRNRYYHDGDKLYYFGSNGDAITGLRHYGNNKLEYYGEDHVQYRNRYATVGNTRYYFGSNGDAVSTN